MSDATNTPAAADDRPLHAYAIAERDALRAEVARLREALAQAREMIADMLGADEDEGCADSEWHADARKLLAAATPPAAEAATPTSDEPRWLPATQAVPGKTYWLRWPGETWRVATRFIGGWNVATSGYGHTKYDEDTPSLDTAQIVELLPPRDAAEGGA